MTGIVIQARMGSSRLPQKILMPIGKSLLLEHILFRLGYLPVEAKVIIATTVSDRDDAVKDFCRARGVDFFRGDECNVLDRYYECALHYGLTNIVRLTGDNPFPDIEELGRLIEMHASHGNDYSECFSVLPVGAGMEVFSLAALETSRRLSTQPHHFEHVNEYILENKTDFKCETLKVSEEKNRPGVRLTVDTRADYELACRIVENASNEYITTQEAVRLCLLFA